MSRRLIAAVILAVTSVAAAAAAPGTGAEVEAWFRTDASIPYRGEKAAIEKVFVDAESADVPAAVLLDKLREGARKKVPAPRLRDGLEAELSRLVAAAAVLAREGVLVPDPSDREDLLRSMSLSLLGGFPVPFIEDILAVSIAARRDPLDAAAALGVLIEMRDTSRLGNEALAATGQALLRSRLAAAAFRSLPAFFARAAARGMPEQEILDRILLPVLAQGGAILQMDEALRRWAERSGGR